jgi:hypothetical protein
MLIVGLVVMGFTSTSMAFDSGRGLGYEGYGGFEIEGFDTYEGEETTSETAEKEKTVAEVEPATELMEEDEETTQTVEEEEAVAEADPETEPMEEEEYADEELI